MLDKIVSDVVEFDKKYGIYEEEDSPTLQNLFYNSLGIAGESGEVVDVVKKIWRDGDSLQKREDLEEELCDLLIYVAKMIIVGEIDIEKAWDKKQEVLHERWDNKKTHKRQEA